MIAMKGMSLPTTAIDFDLLVNLDGSKEDRSRDTQKTTLYKAEQAFAAENKVFGFQQGVTGAQYHVARILASDWWRGLYPEISRVEVRSTRVRSTSRGFRHLSGGSYINLAPGWGTSRGTVLHELAHTVTPKRFAAHGPEYVKNYLTIVANDLGGEVADQLKRRLFVAGIRVATGPSTILTLLAQYRRSIDPFGEED
jgi:putative metallohydrolase (TIGR04338 family)